MAEQAISELGGERHLIFNSPAPTTGPRQPRVSASPAILPRYETGTKVATRKAFGDALVALGESDPTVIFLDAEVSNSTRTDEFAARFPDRFFEMFIAEQQLIAAATGISARGYKTFASTFAAFLTRAHDFIRMAAISGVDLRITGSHAGVEIGADGPSQMALEDIAMFRSVHGSTVLYPSDGPSTAALVEQMAHTAGVCYLRTTRGEYDVLYGSEEAFPVGGSKTLRSSDEDQVTLIGAGVTVHAALDAYALLPDGGIHARVIDLYSVKPVDVATLRDTAAATDGRIVIAEDHHPEGGLGSAVIDSLTEAGVSGLAIEHLAVRGMPGSGTGAELPSWAGIDGPVIAEAARRLLTDA